MGQVALGIKNLAIKFAIFFVMAVLLAWALGGTLWPRAEIVDFASVSFDGREWYWSLAVGGRERGSVWWMIMVRSPGGEGERADSRAWVEVAGPIATDDALYYAGRASFNPAEPWRIMRIDSGGESVAPASFAMPDRLAVEQQLARLEAGLELQDIDVIRQQHKLVLDPPPASLAGEED